jgi:hypothetical protein
MSTKGAATVEDLYREPGKAEIVGGELVRRPPTGDEPGYAGDEIFVSLREHSRRTGAGRAVSDNKVYRAANPRHPTVYRRGDAAEAEPAVPGWRMDVDDLFPQNRP